MLTHRFQSVTIYWLLRRIHKLALKICCCCLSVFALQTLSVFICPFQNVYLTNTLISTHEDTHTHTRTDEQTGNMELEQYRRGAKFPYLYVSTKQKQHRPRENRTRRVDMEIAIQQQIGSVSSVSPSRREKLVKK